MSGAGVSAAPSITTQPASQAVSAGQTATFSVTAAGAAPLSYQWSKNGAAISGATSATYSTPTVATSDTGSQFAVVITNSAGNVTSNAATLTVTTATVAPSITTQPTSKTITAGQATTFSVASTGTTPLSYQWRKNGTAISGAISATYNTPVAATSDTGSQFTVVISNSAGNATSNAAILTVTAAAVAPSITTQPASQTVTVGQAATFSVTASGTAPLSYQWRKNGTAISGATSATYSTPVAATSDTGSQFTVVISNSAGNATSNAATLTVTAAAVAPSITTQPASQTVTVGQAATFSVIAAGTAPLRYQWRKNGTVISGATSSTYITPTAAATDSGSQFSAVVNNLVGNVTSNAAILTVNATPLAITTNPSSATVTAGSTQQFAANVTGSSNTAVIWSVSGTGCSGAACGTISTAGMFVAPASLPSPAAVSVKATSVADPTKSASASVTIVAAVAVLLSISPASASVPTVGTQLFTASVTGTSNTAVTWGLSGTGCSGSSCGTISTSASSAVYSAPSVAPSPAIVKVTVTSAADPTKSASASATVVPVVAVTVNSANTSISTGTTQQFTASVTGTSNSSVAWSLTGTGCSGAACGTISASGLYTAPGAVPSPATVTVTATSASDPTKLGAVNLTILSSVRAAPVLPTLPQATVDITMPAQTGTVRNVAAGNATAFQAAINAATCGDTIVLVAGSTYTGNFTMPNKACSGWILIESSALASLPPSGTRVSGACTPGISPATICPPPSTTNMATITSSLADNPTITFQTAAHNWRLIGLEITQAAGLHDYALIETDNGATTVPNLVNHIIIDHCYIHGTASGAARRGISFQVAYGAVIDSDIREIHDQTTSPGYGSDSQAIASWSGAGPFLIRNNFLSAASENVLFGGATPSIANLRAADITVVGNHFWKDYTKWLGAGDGVKNLFELKNSNRVLIDGNVFDYDWTDAQNGIAILFRSMNDTGGCTWCQTTDVTFTHNLIEHAGGGFNMDGPDPYEPAIPMDRVLIQNNVLTDINGTTYSGTGNGILSITGCGDGCPGHTNDVTIDHNSIFATNALLILGDSGQIANYQLTNILSLYGVYGINGGSTAPGSGTLTTYLPAIIYDKIVLFTASGSSDGNTWPSGTYWNTTAAAGFTNYAGGNYQLTSGSPYYKAGTDGRDIGVWDWTIFNTKTSNALSGIYQ